MVGRGRRVNEEANGQKDKRKVIKNVRKARERSPAKGKRAVAREASFAQGAAVRPRPRPMDVRVRFGQLP